MTVPSSGGQPSEPPASEPGQFADRSEPAPFSSPDAPPYAPEGGWAAYWAAQHPGAPVSPTYPPAAPPPTATRSRGWWGLGAGLVAAAAVVAVVLGTGATQLVNGTATSRLGAGAGRIPLGGQQPPSQQLPSFPTLPGGNGSGRSNGASGSATAAQSRGVVDIYAVEGYQGAEAAGTGILLSADGRVLTNNHVINGSTSIKVIVVSTHKTYRAKVVGTSPVNDLAVLQMVNASGLTPASLGDSDSVRNGDAVTGVGNAGGVGGTPSAARGTVIALRKTITASDGSGSDSERLHNIIVTDAPIKSGDSGGPLYDAHDKVIGVDTAASAHGATRGFAIPINHAVQIARQILSGVETSSIHIGYPGFLAITMQPGTTDPVVLQTIPGGPAAKAGISAGDLITAVNGGRVSSQKQLRAAISSHQPGARVRVTFVAANTGLTRSVTVTLAKGPAD